jgi:hypothetical protein
MYRFVAGPSAGFGQTGVSMFRMKSLRLGNFRSFLDMLGSDEQDEGDAARRPASNARYRPRPPRPFPDRPARMPDDRRERSYVPLDRLARLYGEDRPEGAQQPYTPADDASVADELCLANARTGEDLRRIRRSFAMHNHPDRVPAWLRDEATRRMTIANMLIDRAMREKLKKKSFFG